MKKDLPYYLKEYYFYGVLILIITGMWIGFNVYYNHSPQNGLRAINTGTTDAGDVALELVPLDVRSNQLIIQVRANTHSVDLSQFDLGKSTILTYGYNSYAPSQASSLQGHHASGMLVFPIAQEDVESFKVIVKGIPLQQERVYYWGVEL